MKDMKIYFRPTRFRFSKDPVSCWEEGQEYLICFLNSQNLGSLFFSNGIWTRLLVPKDNSTFSKQIEEAINKKEVKGDFFVTPFTNLKFKPNFSEKVEKEHPGGALLIKDPNRVEKLTETRNVKISSPYQITFKVINQFKGGFVRGEDGKLLSYEESFRDNGSYIHTLEIEPLDLGIENLPPIARLDFSFTKEINPLAAGNYELTKSELYKSSILENSVGKTFTMKIKEFKIDSSSNTLHFSSNNEYVFNSLSEIKGQDNSEDSTKNPPKDNDNPPPKPDPNKLETEKGTEPLKVVLIISGIMLVGLIFLIFIIAKKKKKNTSSRSTKSSKSKNTKG